MAAQVETRYQIYIDLQGESGIFGGEYGTLQEATFALFKMIFGPLGSSAMYSLVGSDGSRINNKECFEMTKSIGWDISLEAKFYADVAQR